MELVEGVTNIVNHPFHVPARLRSELRDLILFGHNTDLRVVLQGGAFELVISKWNVWQAVKVAQQDNHCFWVVFMEFDFLCVTFLFP